MGDRRVVLIAFGSPPPDLLARLPADVTLIISETPQAGFDWRPLSAELAPGDLDHAIRLLEALNALVDESGTPYRAKVRYHGYEPWWFHQQTALDEFLVPFVRYLPLLTRCREAAHVILVDCPDEMRRILPLITVDHRVELSWRSVKPKRLRRIRRAGSMAFYRIVTAVAVARAIVRRPEALVYTVDGFDGQGRNRWIGGLYQALRRRGSRLLEVLWSDGGARALRQWRSRPRLVAYAQAVAPQGRTDIPPDRSVGTTQHNDLVQQFLRSLARNVLMPAAWRSVRSIRRYEQLLRLTRPRGVYLMDDYVHAFDLVVACRRRRVPTVAVQHGQFSRYTAGLMGYGFDGAMRQSYDRYCVWNDYFAQIIVQHSRLVPADSVVVAGSPRARSLGPAVSGHGGLTELDRAHEHASAGAGKRRRSTVPGRAPPDTDAVATRVLLLEEHHREATVQHQVEAYVHALDAAGLDLWIKAHPSNAHRPVRGRVRAGREPLVVDAPLDELFARVDVVVASFSSGIFEAILHAKPVVLFSTSRYRDPHGLAEAGLAGHAASPEEIAQSVRAAARLPRSELIRRRERVWSRAPNDGGEAAVIEMNRLRQA